MGTVYFFNGFLEAGKTTFIKELLSKEYFAIPGRTLIIACEEGDECYDPELLLKSNSDYVYVEDEEDFNEDTILAFEKRYRPERVIVEYNGLWDRKEFSYPWYWDDVTEVAIFDATTYKLYSDNLRSYLAEQVRRASIVIFMRSDEARDKIAAYARDIRAINSGATLIFKGKEGEIQLDINESLPYDIAQDELTLDDVGFAVFCMDAMERYDLYEGKMVHFIARAYEMRDGGNCQFVAGRYVMTCCLTDMSFAGIICYHPKAYEIENKTWVRITATVRVDYDEVMKHDVPVCRVTEIEPIEAPKDEIISMV